MHDSHSPTVTVLLLLFSQLLTGAGLDMPLPRKKRLECCCIPNQFSS